MWRQLFKGSYGRDIQGWNYCFADRNETAEPPVKIFRSPVASDKRGIVKNRTRGKQIFFKRRGIGNNGLHGGTRLPAAQKTQILIILTVASAADQSEYFPCYRVGNDCCCLRLKYTLLRDGLLGITPIIIAFQHLFQQLHIHPDILWVQCFIVKHIFCNCLCLHIQSGIYFKSHVVDGFVRLFTGFMLRQGKQNTYQLVVQDIVYKIWIGIFTGFTFCKDYFLLLGFNQFPVSDISQLVHLAENKFLSLP